MSDIWIERRIFDAYQPSWRLKARYPKRKGTMEISGTSTKTAITNDAFSHSTYPLRVAYDAYSMVIPGGGTGKGAYVRSLLDGYGSSFLGFAPPEHAKWSIPTQADPSYRVIRSGNTGYLRWQQLSLPGLLAKAKPDVFLATYNASPLFLPPGIKMISIIYDLILLQRLRSGTFKHGLIRQYRAILQKSTTERSSLVLTISKFSADQIQQSFPNVKPRVIHCTIAPEWFVRDNVLPIQERDPYILVVTNFLPHKNAPRTLEAFARYRALSPNSKIKLRMIGVSIDRDRAAVANYVQKFQLPEDSIIIDPYLTEEELRERYRRACCVIVPSTMEGFGIPSLEAMASGTPLISSDAWSLPEVGGDVPIYFDPTNVEEMAQALLRVCSDTSLQARMSELGLAQAELFHPDVIRRQIADFWNELPELVRSWRT